MARNDNIGNYIRLLAELPPPSSLPPDLNQVRAVELQHIQCACNKRVPIKGMAIKNSGVINYTNNICQGCEDREHRLVTLVCVTCKRVIARMEPFKDKTGFAFKSGCVYHTDGCPICRHSLTPSPIIEKLLHDRARGIQS